MARTATKQTKKVKQTKSVKVKAVKTKQQAVKVKDLPIVKHAKYYTKEYAVSEALSVIYYDGKTLTATNSHIAIRVNQELPQYQAGDTFSPAGRKKEVKNYPIDGLNRVFRKGETGTASAVLTLSSEEMESWINMLKDLDEMLTKYHHELRHQNGLKMDNTKTTKIELTKEEIKVSTDQIYDDRTGYYHTMTYRPSGKVKITSRHYPMVVKYFNAGYLRWALQVLKESGAEQAEIKVFDQEQLLHVSSTVGQVIVVGIRKS